jgi:hypothetical protein
LNPGSRRSVQVGLYCGITQGMFYDRFGVAKASLLAATLLGLGYLGAYVFLTTSAPAGLLAACFFFIGQGSHGLYTVAAMTNIPNFERRLQGTVMGVLAGAFGLSGALFTAVARALDPSGDSAPPCTGSGVPGDAVVNATGSASAEGTSGGAHGADFFAVCAGLLFVVGAGGALMRREAAAVERYQGDGTAGGDGGESLAMTRAPSKHQYALLAGADEGAVAESSVDAEPRDAVSASPVANQDNGEGDEVGLLPAPPALDITGMQLARSVNFWLLFAALAIDDGYVARVIV